MAKLRGPALSPLGLILFEPLKLVNPRLAQLALVFIIASTTIEAVNIFKLDGTFVHVQPSGIRERL